MVGGAKRVLGTRAQKERTCATGPVIGLLLRKGRMDNRNSPERYAHPGEFENDLTRQLMLDAEVPAESGGRGEEWSERREALADRCPRTYARPLRHNPGWEGMVEAWLR